jgi:hypothetical protein
MEKVNLLNETTHTETIQNLNNETHETTHIETHEQLQETQLNKLQEQLQENLQEELEIERLEEAQLQELEIERLEEAQLQEIQLNEIQEQLQQTQLNETQQTQQTQQAELNGIQKYIFENSNIENELLKTLSKFFNEIDLVFDYIDKQKVSKLQKYLESLKDSTNLKTFVKETILALEAYDKDISYIMTTRNKIKTSEYSFLNNVTLFNNILCFNCFSNENKNTKRSIVKYLYNIYMSVFILNFGLIDNLNIDSFTTHLSNFLNGIQENIDREVIKVSPKSKQKSKQNGNINGNSLNINLLESLMGNSDIMNLATDLSKDIQDQKIDPMMLLSSIMSGKPNNTIQNLVSNITNKIESKINNGEIDKTLFEQQAKNIINSVQNSNGGIPGIQHLFENFK